jgi:hypothetical protein
MRLYHWPQSERGGCRLAGLHVESGGQNIPDRTVLIVLILAVAWALLLRLA